MMADQPIILFDGVCNLCNSSVQYVIKHDPSARFKFAALQSETGQQLINRYGLSAPGLDSFILIQERKAYTQSAAALKVARQLKGAVKLLYGFIIVPPFIRNAVYNVIAKNRYKWFGRKEACMIPEPSLQQRFLK